MRLPVVLLASALAVSGAVSASAAGAPRPQVVDERGDSLGTKSQDIASVLFQASGPPRGKMLSVTMTLVSPVMEAVSAFNYEVDAMTRCGAVSFSFSPGTPYEGVTGLNGWVSTDCGGGVQDLVSATVKDRTITWTMPLDARVFPRGTVFKDFEARIDAANPGVPFPSSATATTLGLVDAASAPGPWRLP